VEKYRPDIEVTVTSEPDSITMRTEWFASSPKADPFRIAPGFWCELERETVLVHRSVDGIDGREFVFAVPCGCSVLLGSYRISVDAT